MAHKTTIATKEKNERLYRAILALETEEECYAFFQDLRQCAGQDEGGRS